MTDGPSLKISFDPSVSIDQLCDAPRNVGFAPAIIDRLTRAGAEIIIPDASNFLRIQMGDAGLILNAEVAHGVFAPTLKEAQALSAFAMNILKI
jgi:hypothetical protein